MRGVESSLGKPAVGANRAYSAGRVMFSFLFLTRKDLHGNIMYGAWLLSSEDGKYESMSNGLIYSCRETDIRHKSTSGLMLNKFILAIIPPCAYSISKSTFLFTDKSHIQNSFCKDS